MYQEDQARNRKEREYDRLVSEVEQEELSHYIEVLYKEMLEQYQEDCRSKLQSVQLHSANNNR